LALVSDAGTPGISDPGNLLIKELRKKRDLKVSIVPVPGPSALIAAASVSGFPMDRFLFLGFPPAKRKRKKFFQEIINAKYPVIFYESSHRLLKTLKELNLLMKEDKGIQQEREAVICRELTKKFETIYWGKIEELIKKIPENEIKGEFVVILERKNKSKRENKVDVLNSCF